MSTRPRRKAAVVAAARIHKLATVEPDCRKKKPKRKARYRSGWTRKTKRNVSARNNSTVPKKGWTCDPKYNVSTRSIVTVAKRSEPDDVDELLFPVTSSSSLAIAQPSSSSSSSQLRCIVDSNVEERRIRKNTIPDESFRLVVQLASKGKFEYVRDLVQCLNSIGHYGALGFSATQATILLTTIKTSTHPRMEWYQLRVFVCVNVYDVWNTDDTVFLDRCFYAHAWDSASHRQREALRGNRNIRMYDVRLFLRRGENTYTVFWEGFIGYSMSDEEVAMSDTKMAMLDGPTTSKCVVCTELDATHCFNLCGHMCMCGLCSGKLTSCPLCRRKGSLLRVLSC